MSLISVIIPLYNSETTIQETIQSVLSQTFSDLELIIINDGSTDSSLEIVSQIQDPRLQVFSYPNGGLAVSRNRGLSHASSEYISFIDADDLWTPDKLELQLKALTKNPQAAVAYSWSNCIDESSQFLRPGCHITANGNVFAQLLLVNFLENGSNPLIRRQALSEVGNFDESLPAAQDWDMWLRLAAKFHFVAIPKPQILYRVSAQSMSTNVLQLERASLQVMERALAQASESCDDLKKPSRANLYKYLTFKALEGSSVPERGLTAARFLWQSLINDPTLLKTRVIWKVLLKIVLVTFLPQQQLAAMKQLSDIRALLVHIKTPLPSDLMSSGSEVG
ncbi:glycosyl transferase, group 2 family protein [Coleofasciculus chthonoplastes PCC 7420]|uniref:Glycosyl transferase, group 2 family protein n=1 Tax=Coleofasciculus chthonoplastes PCC 7420 TaxID=118168 RepID=B4VMI2_9CYAN|nr:glycosyltransferase [Coleofasciculus chthonoplastes]EDX76693.1 glycosyl transferase, group 2 family protein [Coleofasciculus chthonoplastes PCC 7420]